MYVSNGIDILSFLLIFWRGCMIGFQRVGSLSHAERTILKEDPYFQERLQSLKKTAISLSHHRIDHPNKLSALRCCTDIFVQYIVTVQKIDQYIALFKEYIVQDEMEMVRLINLYRVKASCPGQFNQLEKMVFFTHLDWFFQNMSVGSANLVNSFIRLLLVVSKRRYMVWSKFADYFLNFGEIDYHVFFNCVNQCLSKPNQYNIMPAVEQFTHGIEQNIRKFNRSFQGRETDSEVIAVVEMFIGIIVRIKPENALENQLYKYLFHNLVLKDDFNHQFLSFIRKFNKQSLFEKWVQMLIDRRAFASAVKFVQYTLFYCSASATNLKIGQLIEQNEQWSNYWITQLFNNNFIQVSKTFLNGQPSSFMIFNLLLQCYRYESQKQFFQIMMAIDYQDHVKKLKENQMVRESVIGLFRKLSEDCDDVLAQLLEDQ